MPPESSADESSGNFLETAVFGLGLRILMDNNLKSSDGVSAQDLPGADPLIGTTLDERYLIERKLGQGGVDGIVTSSYSGRAVMRTIMEGLTSKAMVAAYFMFECPLISRSSQVKAAELRLSATPKAGEN